MMQEQEKFLDRMFEIYREALGEFEPSREFLPNLWARIESRRPVSWLTHLVAWSPRLAFASAAIAAVLIASMWLPKEHSDEAVILESSYVDVLTLDSMDEHDGALWQLAENER